MAMIGDSSKHVGEQEAGCQQGPDARRVTHEDGDDNTTTVS